MVTKFKWESQRGVMFDDEEFEHVHPMNPIFFYDDFIGAYTAIPANTALESGCTWAKKIVGAAPPTVALVADTATGVAQCALTNDNQKQDAGLYWADDRRFLITQGVVFEARVKVSVLPTDVAEAIWGLVGDWADGPDNITYSVFFTADGSGTIYCESDDDASDQSATSGVTVLNTDWKVYRIDCRDVTSIKFYINGAQVAATTTFPYAATGADATLQPYLGLYKATGTGVGTIQVDYVRIWGNRS